ncbi:MAG TPA: polyphenol oxidase family protein [Candidatus Nanopelagicaceae bacterium]
MARTLFTARAGGDLKLLPNRELLRCQISLKALHFMKQTHSNIVKVVDETGSNFECDALVTKSPGVGLAALAADCMPITFAADDVIGVAHVGRVGLVNKISIMAVLTMRELGAEAITATIGPSICGGCYEVSPEMYYDVTTQVPASATSKETHSLDLRAGVTAQLEDCGVTVINLDICTLEDMHYYSYRRGGETARQSGIVSL